MKCERCKLPIVWFEDSLGCKWFGCECEAKLTQDEYFEEIEKEESEK